MTTRRYFCGTSISVAERFRAIRMANGSFMALMPARCWGWPMWKDKAANLTLEAIPYPDGFFGSVSTLEYVPRTTRCRRREPLPVRPANIIKGSRQAGVFMHQPRLSVAPRYSKTPPMRKSSPWKTHDYFRGQSPMAAIYSLIGGFRVLRAEFIAHKDARVAKQPMLRSRLRHLKYAWRGQLTPFLRKLEAIKDDCGG